MSIDGLVTFVALVVALFALATDARRKSLMLRLGVTVTLTVIFGAAVLYLELFSVWAPDCHYSDAVCRVLVLDGDDPWITPQQAAFVLVLIWLLLVALNLRRKSLEARHVPRLSALITALADEKRYPELSRFAEPHLDFITEVAAGSKGATDVQKEAAIALQRMLYRRRDIVRFLAIERPAMTIRMLAIKKQIVFDFSDQVLTHLIADTDSPLFTEIEDNQNVDVRGGYAFPEHNPYLHFLFGDAEQANRLGAWQPVLQHTLTTLSEAKGQPYQTYLNGPAERFPDLKWRDPTFVSIRYLDLMVDAAMRQGVQWHMWLFYMPLLTKSLLALYDDPRKDQEVIDEWPTRNAYLIYSIFSAMVDWIEAVEHLPDNSPHLVLESEAAVHQNGNIPKSAIIALGDCLRQVLISPAVSDRFKDYLAEIVFRCIDKLPITGAKAGFRNSLIASLIAGGPSHATDHHTRLWQAFGDLDHMLQHRLGDVRTALEAALGIQPVRAPPPRARGPRGGGEPPNDVA
ncbi:hypothetical protein [Brevundimonas sp.]|uniref:hypothetical protein n=1 Tax=Brevundimonas sp. TaxID=1871086 RepID=UPI003D6D5D90